MTRHPTPRGGARRRPSDNIGVLADPYHNRTIRVRTVEHVKYGWPQWYTKVVTEDGSVWHWGPWKTEWAARHCAHLFARMFMQRGQLTGGVHD